MKAFKKGQAVTYITNYNRKGLFVFRQAIVHSCGKVQMVLTDAKTGQEMGRHFKPQVGNEHGGTFPAITDAEAIAKCEELAAAFLIDIAAHYRRLSETGAENGEGYARAMLKNLDELGEPRGLDYHDANDAIRAQFK